MIHILLFEAGALDENIPHEVVCGEMQVYLWNTIPPGHKTLFTNILGDHNRLNCVHQSIGTRNTSAHQSVV